jgi:tRNA(Ile2)-agmatinylcytidine synthase
MFIAVDDTDSVKGNCTTFLATEIIRELISDGGMDLIGNPRLVRLNPAVPWKTRGNGSLVLCFGRGIGKRRFIGMLNGKRLYCFEKSAGQDPDFKTIMERIRPLVERYHEEDSDPGLLISSVRSDPSFYHRGVTTIMDRKEIDAELRRIRAMTFTIGNGRGLIGATCGLAWVPGDSTFELLAYRRRDRWGTLRDFDPLSVRDMEHGFPTTFNSWEDRAQKVAMFPATPCPVLYGLRGDVEEDVIEAAETLRTEERDRWAVYLTNQGTDDHIIRDAKELVPNQSYLVAGTVVGRAKHIPGGHVLMDLLTDYGILTCAAYEPSKEFRMAFDHLIPGDKVEIMGELREIPRTLNAEKLHVVSLVDDIAKVSNPLCPECGKRMESVGAGQGYRCRRCHTRTKLPVTEKQIRWIVPGWYEPPTEERRHLSKPLKRMGVVQPVEFVNRRIQ